MFLADLRSRIKPGHRIQLTTEGLALYERTVAALWGDNIAYTTLHKIYGGTTDTEHRQYSPAVCTGIDKRVIAGDPDLGLASTWTTRVIGPEGTHQAPLAITAAAERS